MSSKLLRLSILGIGAIVFVFLLFADRKALVNEAESSESKAQQSEQFFPSSLIALQPELAAAAEKLASTSDSARLQQLWDEITASSPDTMVQEWCKSQSALLGTDKATIVTQANSLIAFRNHSDTLLQQAFVNLELSLRNKAILMGETNPDFAVERALLLVNTNGRSMEGILELRNLAESNPKNAKIQLILGEFSLQTGQWAKAEERFQNVLNLEKTNVKALCGMALALAGQSKGNEAKEFARKALEFPEGLSEDQVNKLNRLLNS